MGLDCNLEVLLLQCFIIHFMADPAISAAD